MMINLYFFVVVVNGFMRFILMCLNGFEMGMEVRIYNLIFIFVLFGRLDIV